MKDRIRDMDKKILAVFIVLFLFNVILWFYLISFNYGMFNFYLGKNNVFNIGTNFYTIISVLIFFTFMTSKLPKLFSLGNNPLYEFGYLLILGFLGLSMASFYALVNQSMDLYSFAAMVNLLAAILLVLIVASRFDSFKALATNNYSRKDQLVCMVIFLILGFLSAAIMMHINELIKCDIRIIVVMVAGLFGGPIIGIPTAILSSLTLLVSGGGTAICSAVSTIVCGVISSMIYIWNGRKFLKTIPSAILLFLFIGFDMLMIILMTPPSSGVPLVLEMYIPMLFAGLMGLILFKIIIAEIKMNADEESFDAESEIKEIKASLKEHEKKIKHLEEMEKNNDNYSNLKR